MTTKQHVTGNIGEWSEWYAFLKILTDRKMYAADSNLERLEDKIFVVLKVIRDEAERGRKVYDVSGDGNKIDVLNAERVLLGSVPISNIKSRVVEIFDAMKGTGETTFTIPAAEEIMAQLLCTQIKAASSRKADLTVVIHDRISPTTPELGFSVKSMLGASSTLLNASGATNLVFRVEGLTDAQIEAINSLDGRSKIRDRIQVIYRAGGSIIFEGIEHKNFKTNLRKVDTVLPEILGELVKYFFKGNGTTLYELTGCLAKNETLKNKFSLEADDYEFKLKNFLVAVALGMTPGKVWDGFTKAHGGYIIVKENGDIVCYHLYNRDEFQEYLYRNTKLETPSTGRHKFGSIYAEGESRYIKLNLQIRFIR